MIKELHEEFPHLAPTIYNYNLEVDAIREIIEKLISATDTFMEIEYDKNMIEVCIKTYICNPTSLRGRIFRSDCDINGISLEKLENDL